MGSSKKCSASELQEFLLRLSVVLKVKSSKICLFINVIFCFSYRDYLLTCLCIQYKKNLKT
jgi:hypothetical protein